MNAQEKYEIIKAAVQDGNKLRAAVKLSCTVRHINCLIKKYQQEGKATFTFAFLLLFTFHSTDHRLAFLTYA